MLWTDLPRADPCVVEEAPTEGANSEVEGRSTEAVEEEETLLEEARTAKTERNVRTADISPMPEGKSAQQEEKDAVHATNTTISRRFVDPPRKWTCSMQEKPQKTHTSWAA